MTDGVLDLGLELTALVRSKRPDGLTPHRAATAAAEEVGECIGAHNKFADGRVQTLDHFRTEWSQAMLCLVMLGAQYLDREEMTDSLRTEMDVQRRRWAQLTTDD